MNKTTEVTTRVLKVKGRVWQGFNSEYEYPLSLDEEVNFLSCAKRRAGDFESISSAVVVSTTTITHTKTTTKKLKP